MPDSIYYLSGFATCADAFQSYDMYFMLWACCLFNFDGRKKSRVAGGCCQCLEILGWQGNNPTCRLHQWAWCCMGWKDKEHLWQSKWCVMNAAENDLKWGFRLYKSLLMPITFDFILITLYNNFITLSYNRKSRTRPNGEKKNINTF